MELFRALSSMNNGKGLPDQAKVKAMLDWAVWTVDGQFSMELFRALSSMNSSRGLPDQATVKAMLDCGLDSRWPVQYGAVPCPVVHEQLKGLAR